MELAKIINYTNATVIGKVDLSIDIENFVTDSRNLNKGDFYVPIVGEKFDGHDFITEAFSKGAIGCFSTKEVDIPEGVFLLKVDDTLKAYQDVARAYRDSTKVPLVAITGSVGKTTTKDMIAAVLGEHYNVLKTEGNLNNFIGLPRTLLNYKSQEIIVLEMGMNHFNEISVLSNIARPDIAVLTNIGHSHIGNLGSRENILKAKLEIVEGMNENGVVIANNDDLYLKTIKDKLKQKIVTYGIKNKSDYMAYDVVMTDDGTAFKIKDNGNVYTVKINLPGEHLVYNALAAWAVGKLNNVSSEEIVRGIENFKLSKLRMDIREVNNIKIINDTYNANPESMRAALSTLSKMNGERKIAVLADMLELGEMSKDIHFELGKFINDLGIDDVFIYGEEAKFIAKGAIDSGKKDVKIFNNKQELINELKQFLQAKDVVLVKGSRGMKMDEVVNEFINE